MLIKNFKQLASTELRQAALLIAEAGLQAIDTKAVIEEKVKLDGNVLNVSGRRFSLKKFQRIFFVGIGKAAFSSAQALEKILGPRLTQGIALDIKRGKLKYIESLAGDHPFPSQRNVAAADKIKKMLNGLKQNDLVIAVISGGGSALLCSSPKATYQEEIAITRLLFKQGANIEEINILRKHISDLKGGGLAKLAYPATIISLIFSDTPGYGLETVASGPTMFDHTTIADAKEILKKYHLPKINLVETPKDKKYFKNVHNFLLLSNKDALRAMSIKAASLGFKAKIFGDHLGGEAQKLGKILARAARAKESIIGGGETVVKIKGKGKGGRNQEVVLGTIGHLPPQTVIISIASDGKDNTDAAGAIADDQSLKKARRLKLDPKKFLANNDSYHFLEEMGDLIFTGPTGTNVSDLMVVLRK